MTFDHKEWAARRARAAARPTLPARLRMATPSQLFDMREEVALAIEELLALVDQQRRDAIDEQREHQRDVRAAVAEARWQADEDTRGGCY